VLGAPPGPAQLEAYLTAYFGDRLPPSAVEALAAGAAAAPGAGGAAAAAAPGRDAALAAARAALERAFVAAPAGGGAAAGPAAAGRSKADAEAALSEAGEITDLLMRNVEEVGGVLAGLEGRYVPPEAGGDLLRDGPGVLPTGGCWAPGAAGAAQLGG
jgi:magnesium chelatase subunit H